MRPIISLFTALSFGASANSFLIPPNLNDKVNTESLEAAGLAPLSLKIDATLNTVLLTCPSCPYFEGQSEDGNAIYSNTRNSLSMDFAISPSSAILLNGHPILPVSNTGFPGPFTVTQHATDDQSQNETSSHYLVPVDLDLFVETIQETLSRVRIHVLSVAGFRTQPYMDIIEFLLYADDNSMYISEIKTRAPTRSEASASLCRTDMICRWKAYFFDTLARMSSKKKQGGCPKGRKGNKPPATNEGPGHDHRYNHHQHSEEHSIVFSILGFILAIISGTICGMLVSLIGLVVGHFFTLLWRKFTGKPSITGTRNSEKSSEDQEELMKHDELSGDDLPEYADGLPSYPEVVDRK